jgi:hypothetical protein
MTIDESILSDYFACRYKVAIKLGLVLDEETVPAENMDYEVEYRSRVIAHVLANYPTFKKMERLELESNPHHKQESVVGKIVLTVDDLQCHLDGLEALKKHLARVPPLRRSCSRSFWQLHQSMNGAD